MTEPVRILTVEQRAQVGSRVLYRIRASDGERYATTDPWLASLCTRAKDTDTPVRLQSGAGWFYRDLRHVELVPAEVAS